MSITSKQFGLVGSNPFALEGPIGSFNGYPAPSAALGAVGLGDCEGEFVFAKLVLDGSTTLKDGQLYVIDRDYTATPLTTSNSPRGLTVGVGRVVAAVAPAAGTYYIWLQRAGHCPVVATGSGNSAAETTATAGTANFNNTPTTGAKTILGLSLFGTNFTFTCDTVNGDPVLRNVSDTSNLSGGAALAGTGISGTVKSINRDGTVTLSANASATGSAITTTVTGTLPANVLWPVIDKTN